MVIEMSRITIAPIVEGHGDSGSIRGLIQRCWLHLGGEYAEVLRPNRQKRDRLLKQDEDYLSNAIELATLKLSHATLTDKNLILILIDAEDDCVPGRSLGPELLARAKSIRPDIDIACVIANTMYETWFVASYESLVAQGFLVVEEGEVVSENPDRDGLGKGWVKLHRPRNEAYSETIDQPKLTSAIEIDTCRGRSKSFDKLCRELENRI